MFATSTKTATFLPTWSPISMAPAPQRGGRPNVSAPSPGGIDGSPEARLPVYESLALPALVLCRIVRRRRLDRRTSLVRRGAQAFLDEAIAHGIRFARRVDDEQVDGPDIAARPDRWPDGEHRTADDRPPMFGDEHGGVRQEDELAEDVGCPEPTGRAVAQAIAAERDECLDVGDLGRSDPVLHEPDVLPRADGAHVDCCVLPCGRPE